jgi:coenzyme F420 hydrogenase subunit beta
LAGRPSRPIGALLRPILAWLAPRTGPRGLEYARARVEMKAIETVLLLRARQPGRMRRMVPAHIWALVAQYGITEQVTADVSKPAKQRRQRRRR